MIRQMPNGRWQVYGRRNGKKIYLDTVDSKKEAESIERRDVVDQERIAAGELPPKADTKLTFGVAIDRWLDELKASGSRSLVVYTSRVEHHLRPAFEHVPLIEIRKSDVITWRDRLAQDVSKASGEVLSAATINTTLGTLSSAFTFFVGRDWINVNPARGVKLLLQPSKVFPWLQSGETITRLLSECADNVRTLVAVLVGTGLRLDEALTLRWDDVDLEHRLITVHRGSKGTTKSGKARRVPIFDSVLSVLREMRVSRGSNVLLWPGRSPSTPLSQPSVRAPFKRALEHAELPPTLRMHDLRHTFASLYLVDGGDIFKLSRILGHSSVAITEKTYAHLKPDAFEADYGRVAFRMPASAPIAQLRAVG